MANLLTISQISKIAESLKKQKRSIVLAGGCFDVLHPGHIIFLQKAKKAGDILIILLESDEKIKKLKGVNRPVHNQKERSLVLSALSFVDYIILLPNFKKEAEYDDIILKIRPDIIAATSGIGDYHHKRSARLVGAKIKYVTKIIGSYSTTKILNRN